MSKKKNIITKDWKQYEKQVYKFFKAKYPKQVIEFDKKIKGRHSKVKRQIDVIIKTEIADSVQIGVFDCKKFKNKINVRTIDSMVGYMDDLNANYGGIITCIGFSKAAVNRAKASNIQLDIIKFESPEQIIEHFIPKLDFSDARNSMYIGTII